MARRRAVDRVRPVTSAASEGPDVPVVGPGGGDGSAGGDAGDDVFCVVRAHDESFELPGVPPSTGRHLQHLINSAATRVWDDCFKVVQTRARKHRVTLCEPSVVTPLAILVDRLDANKRTRYNKATQVLFDALNVLAFFEAHGLKYAPLSINTNPAVKKKFEKGKYADKRMAALDTSPRTRQFWLLLLVAVVLGSINVYLYLLRQPGPSAIDGPGTIGADVDSSVEGPPQ